MLPSTTVRPLAIITGILLGSSVAITLGLAVVLFIYWLLGGEQPAMQREIPALRANTAIFFGLTVVAAAAFYSQLVAKWWRWPVFAVLVAVILLIGFYYWP